jgi:hypothetical protein
LDVSGPGVPVPIALSRADRQLVEGLRRAGAVNAGAARPIDTRGLKGGRLEKLLEAGILLQSAPGLYYVDETTYERYRRGKRVGALAIVAALLLAAIIFALRSATRDTAVRAPGAAAPVTRASGSTVSALPYPSRATWTVTETGWGPLRAGMSLAAARAALGGELPEPTDSRCDHVAPPGAPSGLLLMTVAGRLARVEVTDTTVATASGARAGDTEARVQQLYAGRVQTVPHKYTDGHYLIVRRGAGADSLYRLVFETDGRRVTLYRAGRFPQVEWVEGCS